MRVLIADDDLVPRCMLQAALAEWGYEVIAASNGLEAWQALQGPDVPDLAILDWEMPQLDGVEVCRRLRERPTQEPIYVILLTSRDAKADVVAGLKSGANDYVTKPFDRAELLARIRVGQTVVELQHTLAARVRELEGALRQVTELRTLLPICSYCRKIRNDGNYWEQVEDYLLHHSDVRFTHGICPPCLEEQTRALRAIANGPLYTARGHN